MSLETKKNLSLVLLAAAFISWVLRRMSVLYLPGLTAFTLAASMLLLGTGLLQTNRQKKILPILAVAFGVFNVIIGALELYNYFQK